MTEKKKVGRPQVLPIREAGELQKKGLPDENTRATFVVNEDLWNQLKEYQNTSKYRTIKDLMDDMIKAWLRDHK